MTSFKDKENATENKFARDQEMEFKIYARRAKLLGGWTAGKVGLSGAEADAYAKSLGLSDPSISKHEDELFHKVKYALASKEVKISDHDIRAEMHHLLHEAKKEVAGET